MKRALAICGVVTLVLVGVVGLHDMSDVTWRGDGRPDLSSAAPLAERLARVSDRPVLRLAHQGRKSGAAYAVTIWFVTDGETIYLTTMNTSRQWVRNVMRTPRVALRIGPERFEGTVTPVTAEPEKQHEYALLKRKYWTMRIMDGFLRVAGRDPARNMDLGRGGFFRVRVVQGER